MHKLPLRFDAERLEREFSQFSENDWTPHPIEAAGDASLILVSVGGTCNLDFAISGPMQPTPFLERCPYLKQVLAAFQRPLSRCRLVRLVGNTETPAQSERSYHWFRRRPIYVPIVTHSAVQFCHNGESLQMAAGEAWTFDNSVPHRLINGAAQECIHLVVEVRTASVQAIQDSRDFYRGTIPVERYCFEVLTPEELRHLTAGLLADVERAEVPESQLRELAQNVDKFNARWAEVFTRFGHHHSGELAYGDLILHFKEQIGAKANRWLRGSDGAGKQAVELIGSMLFTSQPAPIRLNRKLLTRKKRKMGVKLQEPKVFQPPEFDRPLFIVSAPRAGSTMLFETLCRLPDLWTIGDESHEIIEGIAALHPAARNYRSNRLVAEDATADIAASLRKRFAEQLQDREGRGYLSQSAEERPARLRFLEKTPKNALRIPFLKAVFPDARFIFLYRDPAENISSMLEGWRLRRFIAYQPLPGWPYRDWSFLLVEGWENLKERPLVEIATYQWQAANTCILDDLQTLSPSDWCLVRYADLILDAKCVVKNISQFAELGWDEQIEQVVSGNLPISSMALSTPSPEKWRKNEWQIAPILPSLKMVMKRVEWLENFQ
jgi:hypothetical protein